MQCNVGKRGWMGGIGGCPKYEEQYSQALAELRSRGCKVGSPYTAPDGVRRVQIDNFPLCIDRSAFAEAWGQQIADQITGQKPS